MELLVSDERIKSLDYLRQLTAAYKRATGAAGNFDDLLADVSFVLVQNKEHFIRQTSRRGLFLALRSKIHTLREVESKERRIKREQRRRPLDFVRPDSAAYGWEAVNAHHDAPLFGFASSSFKPPRLVAKIDEDGGGRSSWTHSHAAAERLFWTFENVLKRFGEIWPPEWLTVLHECIQCGLKCPVGSKVSSRSFNWRRAILAAFLATLEASWSSRGHLEWVEYAPDFHTYKAAPVDRPLLRFAS